jgi:uncharacterized protein YjbI with pentapeptide repeats
MPDQKIDKASFDDLLALGKEFEGVCFVGCDFQNADLSGFSFEDCEFENCNLSLVKIKNTKICGNKFKSCKMVGVDWSVFRVSLSFANTFENCVLDMSNFTGLNINHIEAYKSSFKEVWFNDANLSDSILKECDFEGAYFNNTNLTKADLRSSQAYTINPQFNKISKAKFSLPEAISLLNGFDITLEW